MNVRKAITIMVILIALILAGTVVVLTTVVQYFGVDPRDIITELEMRLYERYALEAEQFTLAPGSEKQQKVVSGGDSAGGVAPGSNSQLAGGKGAKAMVSSEDSEENVNEFLNGLEQRGWLGNTTATDDSPQKGDGRLPGPRIPKIIHATWKTDVLPERWEKVRQGCIDMHPDYEFKLWSDAASRAFIEEYYPWFLSTFDGYQYPIQRADVIRYFVLHRFGGVYMDLDIGCRRKIDPLLYFEVVVPATIPVGVSNDLMFSEKGHPFMNLVINNLITFDHTYGTNYPTVMFSTGPMFLSAQYGLWPKDAAEGVERQVRVLPRRWYGKNADTSSMNESYFDHYYGSSWHAEDAGFITFLGKFGIVLMYAGLAIVVIGIARLLWSKRSVLKSSPRILGPIALPYNTGSDALPLIRPDTPGGSRVDSPFGGASSSTPGRHRRDESRPDVLYYLPVWFMPPSDRSPGGTSSPRPNHASWSQYFSNLSFVDPESQDHRYQPIPDFSRPPSPSNNSILHAPGSTHDGAFDGMPLHSIHAPRPTRPASSLTSPSGSTTPAPSTSPAPPFNAPPVYSTLWSLGASLFRASTFGASSPRSGVHSLPSPSSPSFASSAPSDASHSVGDLDRKRLSFNSAPPSRNPSPRPRSPLPPQYSATPSAAVRARTPTPPTPSASGSTSETEHGSEYDVPPSEDFDWTGAGGVAVEEEVDRLLSEMAPDFNAEEKGERPE
ncbi:hypothetical protein JCM1841_002770 [Sporobolomyces salmonicolor]